MVDLEQTTDYLHLAFNAMPHGMALVTAEGRWLHLNVAACHLFGYEERQLRAMRYQALLHPDDPSLEYEIVSLQRSQQRQRQVDRRYRHHHGHYILARQTLTHVAHQTPFYILQWSPLEPLQGNNALLDLLNNLLGHLRESLFLIDEQGRLRYVNDVACKRLGYEREHLLRLSMPDIDARWSPIRKPAHTSGKGCHRHHLEFDSLHRHRDGRLLPVTVDGSLLHYAGNCYQMVLAYDLRECLSVEQALLAKQRKYRTLLDSSIDGIARIALDNRVLYLNPSMEDFLGLPRDALLGHHVHDFMPPSELRSRFDALFERIRKSGDPVEEEFSLRGEPHTCYLLRLIAEHDAQGKVISILLLARNLSSTRPSQRSVDETRQQLRQLYSRRENVREEERKAVAREIHDELGQQLTALRMGIGLLGIRFGKQHEDLQRQVEWLMSRVDATIQAVRDVAANLRPPVLDMGLPAALDWLASEFSRRSGVPCRLDLPQGHGGFDDSIATAAFRIAQESLTNVSRHADASLVSLTLEALDDNTWQLEINDDGKGFIPHELPPNTLGLAGIRERSLMLGGRVAIFSQPGQGTTVRAVIPSTIRVTHDAEPAP